MSLMKPTNFFPQIANFIDLHKYEVFINSQIEEIYEELIKNIHHIDINLLKDAFWNLANLEKFNSDKWSHFFAVALIRTLGADILFKENRIKEITLELHQQWFEYLLKRTLPHISQIENELLIKLYSEYAYTRENEFIELIKEGADFILETNLLRLFNDPNISLVTKIRKFKESFLNFYELFLERCSLYGYEMSKYEGTRDPGRWNRNIIQIFYLRSNHQWTPPPLIEEKLDEFRHIRNSLSHSAYSIISDDQIKFKDHNWEKEYTLEEIWLLYYHLMQLDRDFPCVALWVFSLRWLASM